MRARPHPLRSTRLGACLALGPIALLVVACGGAAPSGEREEPRARSIEEEIAALRERARRRGVREVRFGMRIDDPYRSLEEESPLTEALIDLQTRRSDRFLEARTDAAMRERIGTLLSIGTLSSPAFAGDALIYEERSLDQEQPVLMIRDGDEAASSGRALLDPTSFGERAALDYFYPSPGGSWLVHGISHRGDERSTLRIRSIQSGEDRAETIARAKWSDVAWLPDESGFYYTRYPAPGEEGYDPDHPETYFPRVFFHRLGSDPAGDPLVFGSDSPTDFPGVSVSEDGRFVTFTVFRGWSESDVHLFDRGSGPARPVTPDASHPLRTVREGEDDLTIGHVHRGQLYLLTNHDAPKKRILAGPAEDAGRESAFRTVVEEGEGPIEDWAFSGDRLALHRIEDIESRVTLHRLDGARVGALPLPRPGEVAALAGSPTGARFALTFSSFVQPPTIYVGGREDGALRPIARITADVDFDALGSSRHEVASADGTPIPVTLVHRGALERTRDRPVLLYGYGGFDVSLLPGFRRNLLYWVERGGIYAIAHLRGGGERGEAWHRAGMRENKVKTFEDFEAIITWLGASGISRPERIGITGGSNGGLTIGAMLARIPERFGAAAAYVGLYDMARFHLFPPAELWVSEYGDPREAEDLRFLLAYSPYHRLRPGQYPPTLIETAAHDTRVHFGHSLKFAARLQDAQRGEAPILFRMERETGHGAGTRRSDLIARYVRMYAFFEWALRLEAASGRMRASPGRRCPDGVGSTHDER